MYWPLFLRIVTEGWGRFALQQLMIAKAYVMFEAEGELTKQCWHAALPLWSISLSLCALCVCMRVSLLALFHSPLLPPPLLALCSALVSNSLGTFSFVQYFPISPVSFEYITGAGSKSQNTGDTQNIICQSRLNRQAYEVQRVLGHSGMTLSHSFICAFGCICNECRTVPCFLTLEEENKSWLPAVGSALPGLNTESYVTF